MVESLEEFGSAQVLTYPGTIKSAASVVQELGWYTKSTPLGVSSQKVALVSFGIDRHVSWYRKTLRLKPLTYSAQLSAFHHLIDPQPVSIDDYVPMISVAAIGEAREQFVRTASGLEGFVNTEPESVLGELEEQPSCAARYQNREVNLSIIWDVYFESVPRIGVHVTQTEPVTSLDAVVQGIVPHAVSVFNRLEPANLIDNIIVRRVIDLAYVGYSVMPQCRIERK